MLAASSQQRTTTCSSQQSRGLTAFDDLDARPPPSAESETRPSASFPFLPPLRSAMLRQEQEQQAACLAAWRRRSRSQSVVQSVQ